MATNNAKLSQRLNRVHRLIRVGSAYITITFKTVSVITGIPPIKPGVNNKSTEQNLMQSWQESCTNESKENTKKKDLKLIQYLDYHDPVNYCASAWTKCSFFMVR